MAKKQQGSVALDRSMRNKGSVMSGDDAAASKLHRRLKRALRYRM